MHTYIIYWVGARNVMMEVSTRNDLLPGPVRHNVTNRTKCGDRLVGAPLYFVKLIYDTFGRLFHAMCAESLMKFANYAKITH